MPTTKKVLAGHVAHDHARLIERLRSLDNCLENILYYGEVCSDLRGFGGLRKRCQELQNILENHIPEEEEMYGRLKSTAEVRRLLGTLVREHGAIQQALESCLRTLAAIETTSEPIPEDLFTLQDRVRGLVNSLRQHIETEDRMVLPLVA
jgi:hemerythrin-like domain-containing protein